MSATLPLILLPGMGADERIFRDQAALIPNLILPRWIPHRPHESLVNYARRMATEIDPGVPCCVGGASFGGFVAMEMIRALNARACFLIGSVRSPTELPLRLRALSVIAPLARLVPFEPAVELSREVVDWLGGILKPNVVSFLRQLAATDSSFLRWGSEATLTWRPTRPPADVPVFQIHGRRDRVLPVKCTHPTQIIETGGHVISLTHGEEVSEFLNRHLAEISNTTR